jgi:hypothetical protein
MAQRARWIDDISDERLEMLDFRKSALCFAVPENRFLRCEICGGRMKDGNCEDATSARYEGYFA